MRGYRSSQGATRRYRGVFMFSAFLQWLLKFVPEVPEEIAVCEFDCRKTECLMGHWAQCERRLKAMPHTCEKKKN
jgi:hypothetical protein